MAATSTSPVKILLDLGYEMVDIESDTDYLSALMEAIVSLQGAGGSGRARADILQEELKRVRKDRKAASPSKGMKLTLKKKNISAQKLLTSSKEAKAQTEGGGGDLLVIKEKVVAIEALLGEQYKLQEENAKDAKQEAEKKRRSLKERLLEGSGKVFDGVKKATNTVLKPFKSVWENIIGFIKKIILGRVLMNILEWTSDPKNAGKIDSIFKFLGDWWPALLAAYLVFGNGLSKFVIGLTGKLVVLGAKLVATVIPALIKAAAAMGPWGVAALGVAAVTGAVLGAKALDGDFSNKERTDEEKEADKEKADSAMDMGVLSMNTGGTVPGSGNTDTVPAMLTPGEFVMSKGAVQKYGANTLAGMNAAAGGTNRPTLMGGYKEGGKAADRSHFGTEGYRMGQILPEQLYYNFDKYTSSYKTKDGEVVEDKDELIELSGAIGMPDLIKNQTQLVDSLRRVKGYEDVNFMDVVQYPDGGGRLVDMPPETLYPILSSSDAWKASDAKRSEAIRIDMESGTQFLDPTETAKMVGLKGGGLVPIQGLQGGGQVRRLQMGRGAAKRRMEVNNITPPISKPKVTVVNQPGTEEVDASQAQLPAGGNREIPSFDATLIRSSHKMEVLGISA
jgi:hypothetical protein